MSKKRKSQPGNEKYLLCQMPAAWAALPVYPDLQPPLYTPSIAIYTKNRANGDLSYAGYILPPIPVPLSVLKPAGRSPRCAPVSKKRKEESYGEKYKKLLKKIRAEEAAANLAHQSNSPAGGSKHQQGVDKAGPSATAASNNLESSPATPVKREASEVENLLKVSANTVEILNDLDLPDELLIVPQTTAFSSLKIEQHPWPPETHMDTLLCPVWDTTGLLMLDGPAGTCYHNAGSGSDRRDATAPVPQRTELSCRGKMEVEDAGLTSLAADNIFTHREEYSLEDFLDIV